MSKGPGKENEGEKPKRKALMVICREGLKQRFLRGMIVHDLVQRGLEFDPSYAIARAVRDRLGDREEVTTVEILDLVTQELEALLGPDQASRLVAAGQRPALSLFVQYDDQRQPFSRGLLARSIAAAGFGLDHAYRLVADLEADARAEGIEVLARADVARRTAELIEETDGAEAARRYRLMRRIRRLPRPIVIYIGGASGTGKSTLAFELAPLLHIYRVIATDTIRQVMRMVFSPAIMPALYHSSFEVQSGVHRDPRVAPAPIGQVPKPTALLIEQSTRVLVGIRAVVERAISENVNIVVEGVHLCPPLIPFADLEGAAYQVPLMLGTLDKEVHRSRFVARARLGGRRAERYLEGFRAICEIQEHILAEAETNDVPLLDTSRTDPPVFDALRLITGVLQDRFPIQAHLGGHRETIPAFLLIIDGLADRPVRALGGRTPLAAADTPTLDRLATEGACGLADPVAPGVVPDTASGTLALFGQSPAALQRGPVEALGAGIRLRYDDVALRGNFATIDGNGNVVDRRAGRIRESNMILAQAIDRMPLPGSLADEVEIRVRCGTEHRLAIVLRGEGLSSDIHGSDPGEGATPGPPLSPRPNDTRNEAAVYTARILALFEQEARRVLNDHPVNVARRAEGLPEANLLLTRGAGRVHKLIALEEAGIPLRVALVSGDSTIAGIASHLGADVITRPGMTANLDTDLDEKFLAVREALTRNDLVVLHVKGADIAAHDQRPELKSAFIEQVDVHLGRLLDGFEGPLRVAVASDHATLSESGLHAADPLPVIVWGPGIEPDATTQYSESAVAGGSLGRFPLQMLLGKIFRLG